MFLRFFLFLTVFFSAQHLIWCEDAPIQIKVLPPAVHEENSFSFCAPECGPSITVPSKRTKKDDFYFDVPHDNATLKLLDLDNPDPHLLHLGSDAPEISIPEEKKAPVPPTPLQRQIPSDSGRVFEISNEGSNLFKHGISQCDEGGEGYTINFENISIVQLLRFVSRISGINFIFDPNDLQFNVTIVSQEPASSDALTSALVQVLKVQGLSVVEQGGTILIYANQSLSRISRIVTDENVNEACDSAVVTRVFRIHNVEPGKVATIVKPLLSKDAIVEVSESTRHVIVSDITSNVDRVAELLNAIDMPNAAFEVAEYSVRASFPKALASYAKEILTPIAQETPYKIITQAASNKIFIVSTPYVVTKALQILDSLDTADITDVATLPADDIANSNIFMYKLRYHNGKDIANSLRDIGNNLQYTNTSNVDLVNAIYSAQFMEVNNSIVITGSKTAVEKVVVLLEELDKPPKQVFLEVLVIDTTLQNSLDFGVQWVALGNANNELAYATGLLGEGNPTLQGTSTTNPGARFVSAQGTPPPLIPNPGRDVALPNPSQLNGFNNIAGSTEAFGMGFIGNIIKHNGMSFLTLGSLVSALEEESDTSIVLNPRIMTVDTQEATLFVGENIPYSTTNTIVGVTGASTQNTQYEDIGVELRVTPTIAPNNIVSIDIQQTIAEVVSIEAGNFPTTSRINTSTRVHVPDGSFLVMSGQVRDRLETVRSGVPCLGTLPWIGPTFSRNVELRSKRNLIFFIRPQVVYNFETAEELTNRQGYEHNWNTNPCSLNEAQEKAPETEKYPMGE
jgi:type III secretion protein C